jgi:glutamate decarboxylase
MSLTHVSRIVPNYDLAPDLGKVDILRVVVKENFTEALMDRLICDIVCIRAPCFHCPRLTIGQKVEITEDLVKQDTPAHALAKLGVSHAPSSHEKAHGRVEQHEVDGQSSGTYSKTC